MTGVSHRVMISLAVLAPTFSALMPANAESAGYGVSPPVPRSSSDSGVIDEHRLQPASDGAPSCLPPPEKPYDRSWNLSAWLAGHGDVRGVLGALSTTQSGNGDPAPFAGTNWAAEIRHFRTAWSAVLGPIPKADCVALDPQVVDLNLTPPELARIDTSSYEMKRVTYRGAHGERIPAFLLIPHNIVGRVPAVLVMHQTLPVCGKKEPAGVCLSGTPWLDFARDLAQQGYVTLAPDSIGFGERSQYYDMYGMEYADAAPLLGRFPSASLMGLMISDAERGLDFLQTLPYVDRHRLGMIGHSSGGTTTLFTAAVDPRIKCAVTNAAPNLIRRETQSEFGLKPGISRWAGFAYLPAMGFYSDVSQLPIEMHQLYAMIAPRGLFVSLMEDDSIAPVFDHIQFSMEQTKRAFAALGGNFAYHTITTGLTPARHREWAAPMCMSVLYDACNRSGDPSCLSAFNAASMNATCVANHGSSAECAHTLWMDCLATPHTAVECQLRFASLGVTDACVEQAFTTYLRRDHGWYPETETLAYPWLESCLKG